MAIASMYLNAFWSGGLDAFWPHIILLGTSIAAEFAVALGIILESPKEKACREKVGMILVLGGVSIGAICTIGLFVFDEGVSRAQQSVIIQLKTPRTLSTLQKERIAAVAKKFPSIKFVAMANPDAEPWNLVLEISGELKKAGWDWQPFPTPGLQPIDGRPREGMTIADHIEIQALPGFKDVAAAMADAIRDPDVIGMADVRVVIIDTAPAAIVVIVGSKT